MSTVKLEILTSATSANLYSVREVRHPNEVGRILHKVSLQHIFRKSSPDKCFAIIDEGRGKHFDPRVVDAMAIRRSEVIDIAMQLAD